MYEIALREPLLPVIYEPKEIKTPWWKSKKIIAVDYIKNEMVVFRVTPHANVAAKTKRMWRNIHKMYEMYANPLSRLERDGLKFRFREKDSIWIDVIFRQVKGKKKIEFYVATTEFQAEKLKRRLENMMHVTLNEASLSDIEIPLENTVVQEVRYTKHDIFSLETDTSVRKTPISTVLSTVDELVHDGDFARLSICADHEARKKWAKSAVLAHDQLREGKIPQRFNMKQFAALGRNGLYSFANGLHSMLTDMFEAIHNSFYDSDKPLERGGKLIDKRYSMVDELNTTSLSEPTKIKPNLPVFRTHIKVAAHSKDKLTRETIADSLGIAISETSEDNELKGIPVKGKIVQEKIKELNTLKLSQNSRLDPNVNLMSTDEIAKLAMQYPDRDLQMNYADELDTKYRIEVDVPAPLRDKSGIPLGVATMKDKEIPVYMPISNPNEFYRSYAFIGGMGTGKDTALKNWIIECAKRKVAAVVIDSICEPGEDGLADGLRDSLPPGSFVDLDLGHDEYAVPLDLTEVVNSLGVRYGPSRFAGELINMMELKDLKRNKTMLRAAAKASKGSLVAVKRIIEDEFYRNEVAKELDKEDLSDLAYELRMWGSNKDMAGKADAVLDRLDNFFGDDKLHDIFSQEPIPELDFKKWITEGKIIILRVPNSKLGELATQTLVHWIVLKTYMTRLLMEKEEQENGCFVVFNEPEQYMTPGLMRLMGRIGTEGRKHRIGALFAFHHWNKLPHELQENLLAGGVQLFMYANDHRKTFEISEHRFKETVPMEQAEKLPNHYAIVSLRTKAGLQPAFICYMNPPPLVNYDNSHITEEHTIKYGRHWKTIKWYESYDDE